MIPALLCVSCEPRGFQNFGDFTLRLSSSVYPRIFWRITGPTGCTGHSVLSNKKGNLLNNTDMYLEYLHIYYFTVTFIINRESFK